VNKLVISTMAITLVSGITLCGSAFAGPASPSPLLSSSSGTVVQVKMTKKQMMMMKHKKMMMMDKGKM